MVVDTYAGPVRVEWDSDAAVTALGHFAFFVEYLKLSGRFDALVADCPLVYASGNAPAVRDVIGTAVLGILAGHWRYAHLTALRGDSVSPALLGMSRVVSEDAVRRGFGKIEAAAGETWLHRHLQETVEPVLSEPWVMDCDTTVKPLYGHQEGAVVGYNPHSRDVLRTPTTPSRFAVFDWCWMWRSGLGTSTAPSIPSRICGRCWMHYRGRAGLVLCGATRTGATSATWRGASRKAWLICSSCA
jgi:hypothetical protein